MNECIVHYKGLSRYNPAFATKKTFKTIYLAKEVHEK